MLNPKYRIKKYASKGREAFEGDELIQSWIVHHLQIIGEDPEPVGQLGWGEPGSKLRGENPTPILDLQ